MCKALVPSPAGRKEGKKQRRKEGRREGGREGGREGRKGSRWPSILIETVMSGSLSAPEVLE
jgi:hypothetical protein